MHEARFTNVSIFNEANPVMSEAAVCQCAFLIQTQCFCWGTVSIQHDGIDTSYLWLEPAVARKAPSCPFSMLLLESLYQVWCLQPYPQTGLAWPPSYGKGEDRSLGEGHPCCEEDFWIIHTSSPGKWWALAACVHWPLRHEPLDLGDWTSGELHARTLFLPHC